MKKLTCLPADKILPTIILIFPILLVLLPIHQVKAQESPTKEITCEEAKKILQSAECPNWIKLSGMLEMWCYDDEFNGEAKDVQAFTDAIMSRPPSYILDSVSCLEGTEIDQKESEQQDAGQTAKPAEQGQPNKNINPVQALNDWIKDTFSEVDFEAAEAERLYGRTPQMTEEIIQQYQAEQKALYEGPVKSPYRLDIQKGDIAIKLPGQTEWSTLKQGDRIPSGSTIFTGMDSTTVLSIRDKGVIQVQSFTEITVTEKGLEEAAKTGQTYTDIELRTGEVELNVPGGVFTGSLQVHTPNFVAGVRGTHFWVSYDKDKKLSTTGVYKGQVEVKAKGSSQTTLVSPNGDKPGVVAVAQKLSTIKLAIAALVVMVIIGGAMFILRKRFFLKSFKKRK